MKWIARGLLDRPVELHGDFHFFLVGRFDHDLEVVAGFLLVLHDQNLADLVRRNIVSAPEARAKAKFPENFPG